VLWGDPPTHDAALDELLDRGSRNLSLVDLVSFVVMRRRGINEAFAFDRERVITR
jgi:predicted nucleic acid-binding protein